MSGSLRTAAAPRLTSAAACLLATPPEPVKYIYFAGFVASAVASWLLRDFGHSVVGRAGALARCLDSGVQARLVPPTRSVVFPRLSRSAYPPRPAGGLRRQRRRAARELWQLPVLWRARLRARRRAPGASIMFGPLTGHWSGASVCDAHLYAAGSDALPVCFRHLTEQLSARLAWATEPPSRRGCGRRMTRACCCTPACGPRSSPRGRCWWAAPLPCPTRSCSAMGRCCRVPALPCHLQHPNPTLSPEDRLGRERTRHPTLP
jgi:hypothetical protein